MNGGANRSGDGRFNQDFLVMARDYARTMAEAVMPYIDARRTDLTVAGEGGVSLFCSRFDAEAPRGTVMIVHGFTENADKFSELTYSLMRNGYSVVAYDQRGHGRSRRDPEISDISLTHTDRFENYVRDMERVRDELLKGMPKPWMLFCHSMGGAVSALFLEDNPGVFARVAMCAPMIEANLGGLPVAAAALMCAGARTLGMRKRRIFSSRPYDAPENFETAVASGRERFDWYEALRQRVPAFRNNGPTYGWVQEAIRANRLILADGAVERIDVPVRVYTAENDTAVMPGAQAVFASRLRNGRRTLVKGTKHEIYRAPDDVLFPWWREILEFFAESRQGR